MNEKELVEKLRILKEFAQTLGFSVEFVDITVACDTVCEISDVIPKVTGMDWTAVLRLTAPLEVKG